MDWLKIAKTYEPEYIEKVTKLLQIPTALEKYDPNNFEAPFGENIRKALDFMLDSAAIDGFKTADIEHYSGHIEMGKGKEILGILGHLDVVPAGGKWNDGPFSATLKDGKIYARGAMDDKGPTVAAYFAMKMIKDQNIQLNKRVRLILGCDEESGMRGIKRYLETEDMPDIGFAPDADFPLIYGEKGIFSFDITGAQDDQLIKSISAGERYNVVPDKCEALLKKDLKVEFMQYLADFNYSGEVDGDKYTIYGKNAHAALPFLGVNAIFLMIGFLKDYTTHPAVKFIKNYLLFDHYGKNLGINYEDVEMKELTINTALITFDGNKFKLGCNIRYPKGYDFEAGLTKIAACAKSVDTEFAILGNSPFHYISPKDPLVKTLHEAYIKYTDDKETPLLTIGGGTYARVLKKAVAFGAGFPGEEDLAHQPNEYLVVENMLKTAAIYAEAIEKLAGQVK